MEGLEGVCVCGWVGGWGGWGVLKAIRVSKLHTFSFSHRFF